MVQLVLLGLAHGQCEPVDSADTPRTLNVERAQALLIARRLQGFEWDVGTMGTGPLAMTNTNKSTSRQP